MVEAQEAKKNPGGYTMRNQAERARVDRADFIRQLLDASELLEANESTRRQWVKMTNDPVFGPELLYVMTRAFRQRPFTIPTEGGGLSCLSHGYYRVVMNPDDMGLSVRVVRGTSHLKAMWSFCIHFHDHLKGILVASDYEALNFGAMARQFWLVRPNQSVTLLDLPVFISGKGGTLTVPDKWPGTLEELSGFWSDLETDQLLIILTGKVHSTRGSSYTRLDFTVVKPPKESEDSQ